MQALKFIFVIALLSCLDAMTALSIVDREDDQERGTMSSTRGINGRFLAGKTTTCDEYPRVCRARGSPGPDCCKKKCVDVARDGNDCGKCGNKCRYSQVCCKGKCVSPLADRNNCGGCSNKCKSGSKCVYGMCSYA